MKIKAYLTISGLLLGLATSFNMTQDFDNFVFVEGNDTIPSFYMSKYEVTIAEFMDFQQSTSYKTVAERLDSGIIWNPKVLMAQGMNYKHDLYGNLISSDLYEVLPVTRVCLEDAEAYAKWKGGRIPTNIEWAYAAKGGKLSRGYKYPGGNRPHKIGLFDGFSRFDNKEPKPVGSFLPNELGLYDMGGNVAEITYDATNKSRVRVLGGSYFEDISMAENALIDKGVFSNITFHNSHPLPLTGFRIIRDAK